MNVNIKEPSSVQYDDQLQENNIHIEEKEVSKLNRLLSMVENQNIKVGSISKELYEQNLINLQLRKQISNLTEQIKKNNNDEIKELYANEINTLRNQLIKEKKEKVTIQEELLFMYEREGKILKSYKNLLRKYNALSNSKLGKLTLAYWKFRSRNKGRK